jgi:nucleoside-diphosphate-sugar epimerase
MKRLLIIGCGDVARRALPALLAAYAVSALARSPEGLSRLAALGARPIAGDLDRPETLAGVAGGAELVLHSAPPQGSGDEDLRTRNLIAAFEGGAMVPQRIVYLSTSGVYGDCRGAWVDELHPLNPGNDRARRRADAEARLAQWCARRGVDLVVLRVPGIYASERLPVERLRTGMPALRSEEDVFTNHIHADDLAEIICVALHRGDVSGTFNASDDSELRMGEYFDLVADRLGVPRAPRISREQALERLSPLLLSFMSESRRLSNRRMKEVLGIRLRYPTVYEGVPRVALAV